MAPNKKKGKKAKKSAARVPSSVEQQPEAPPAPPTDALPSTNEALPSTSNNPSTSLHIPHEEAPATDPVEQNPGSDAKRFQTMVDKNNLPKQGRKVMSRGRPAVTQRQSTPRWLSVDEVDPTPGTVPDPTEHQHADRPIEPPASQAFPVDAEPDRNDGATSTDPDSTIVRLAGPQSVMQTDTFSPITPVLHASNPDGPQDDEQASIPELVEQPVELVEQLVEHIAEPIVPGAWPLSTETPDRNVARASVEDENTCPPDEHHREESVAPEDAIAPPHQTSNTSSSTADNNAAPPPPDAEDPVNVTEDEFRAHIANLTAIHENLQNQHDRLFTVTMVLVLVVIILGLNRS